MRTGLFLAVAAAVLAAPAHAAGPQVEGAIYVERRDTQERLVEPAALLRSGDKVVLLVRWQAAKNRDGFTVTTPVPSALAFQRDSSEDVEVSVDGGRSWSRFGKIRGAARERITHLRWHVDAREAARGSGSFAYSALVR